MYLICGSSYKICVLLGGSVKESLFYFPTTIGKSEYNPNIYFVNVPIYLVNEIKIYFFC